MNPVHRSPVIDGLVYFSDGDPEPLRLGNVCAANITVAGIHAELDEAFAELGQWHKRLSQPDSNWRLVRTTSDILAAQKEGRVGLILGWQNALPFGTRIDRVAAFHALGLRVVQLTHNQANMIGDGCLEERNSGLTRFGSALIAEMNDVGIAIDLSHCGERTTIETARTSTKPVLVTHSNAKRLDDRIRNKSDEAIRAVADSGGVIGTSIHGFMNWDGNPEHPPTLANFVRHARYVADLVGVEHVGIGTDFTAVQDEESARFILDQSKNSHPETGGKYAQAFGNSSAGRYPIETPTPLQFPRILEALETGGFSREEVDAIAGGNFLRAFQEIWD